MRRKIKLKRKIYIFKKEDKLKKAIFVFILIIVSLFLAFRYINMKATPILLNYAGIQSKKIAGIVINDAVSKNFSNIDIDELFLITKGSDNEIKTIDFNPIPVNKILSLITISIQKNLKNIEEGKLEALELDIDQLSDFDIEKLKKGIIYEIPSGIILNKSILANTGPKIPVKLSLIGSITSYVNTKVTSYGINNALVEVNVILNLTEQVILPFAVDELNIETSIPVAMKLIEGSVPNYYLNGLDRNSTSIALPSG